MPVSETLLELLTKISSKFDGSFVALMIGNMVASVVNCGPTDLMISIAIACERNKTLIQNLNKLGVCASHDENLLFRYSAAVEASKAIKRGSTFEKGENSNIIHGIADNFDCEICSLNNRKTCHCLARILAQTEKLIK